tara:strand:- start:1383 stop:1865 length:483 start_codon:yes stop_codon:yes gene_type:complete
MIAVLCADTLSNYFKIISPDLDIYTIERPAQNYKGTDPVIAHPPCPQWSKLRAFAKFSQVDLDLAAFCVDKVQLNGGILEHPEGSTIFKHFGLYPIYSVDQSWWGFRARKRTYLYLNGFKLLPYPAMPPKVPDKRVDQLNKRIRSRMPLEFCQYLANCLS